MRPACILFSIAVFVCIGCSGQESTTESSPASEQLSNTGLGESTDSVNATTEDVAPSPLPKESEPPTVDATTLYRDAQDLMKDGKREQGYQTAKKAMAQFIAEDIDLAWMLLESITVDEKRVDIHFNMGPRERQMPDDGIVRPLSFRIWSTGDDPDLLQVLDFEIGRGSGRSITAAIGEMTETGHANYGILDVDSSYEAIRERVLELIVKQ